MSESLISGDGQSGENRYLAAAHQLRSPLVAMRTVLQSLLYGELKDREKSLSLLAQLDERCGDMLAMVNDLLSLGDATRAADGEAGGADPDEILRDVIESLGPVADKRGIKIVYENSAGREALMDPVALEHVCANLVENAVKYSNDGGEVSVAVRDEGDMVAIEVRDSGIGIPAGDIEKIFEEFHRADNARRMRKQGTGLGLPIVKKFVERAGGGVEVKSAEGEGTTVTVSLPAK